MRDSAKTGEDIQVMKCSTAIEAANGFMTEYADVMCRLASGEKGAEMDEATVKEVTVKEGAKVKVEVEFSAMEWAMIESWIDFHREELAERWRAETPEQVVHLLTMHGMDETDSLFPVAE